MLGALAPLAASLVVQHAPTTGVAPRTTKSPMMMEEAYNQLRKTNDELKRLQIENEAQLQRMQAARAAQAQQPPPVPVMPMPAPAPVVQYPQYPPPPGMDHMAPPRVSVWQGRTLLDKQYQQKQEGSMTRRLAIPAFLLAGSTGALFAKSYRTPLIAQELLTDASGSVVTSSASGNAVATYFPGALSSLAVDRLTASTLKLRGYTPDNTLFATSICSDEINAKSGEMVDLMVQRWGEMFTLGGLAGFPFVGKAGAGAYAHHVPVDGKMFIVFAPHVGIEGDGKVGVIKRENQEAISTACGAAVGAYKALMKEKGEGGAPFNGADGGVNYLDQQIQFIISKLRERIEAVDDSPDAMTFVTYQLYIVIRQLFIDQLTDASGLWDDGNEVTILGGVQINRSRGGDRFMPLMMQSLSKDGTVEDLYEQTFGKPKDVSSALNGAISNEDLFDYPFKASS